MENETEALRREVEDLRVIIDEIDGALCNYINGCRDPYEPVHEWGEDSEIGFKRLCESYNKWHRNNPKVGEISQEFYCGAGRQLHDLSSALHKAEMKIRALERAKSEG